MIDGGLRKEFHSRIRGWHWQAIETAINGGVPDSNYCAPNGAEGWIEFKRCTANAVKFQSLQPAWLTRRARMGGRVWIGVRQQRPAGARTAARDGFRLYRGADALLLASLGLRGASPVGIWAGAPSEWDWQKIAFFLCTDGG